jgi:hypothetical protein
VQILRDRLGELRPAALRVEIFDAQHEFPAVMARAFLRAPESEGVPKMQIARGVRREAAAVMHSSSLTFEV